MYIELTDLGSSYLKVHTKDESGFIKNLDYLDMVYKNTVSEGYKIMSLDEVLEFSKTIKEPLENTKKEIALLTLIKSKKYKGAVPSCVGGLFLLLEKIKGYCELEIEQTESWIGFIYHRDDNYLEEIKG